jgi:hypothetical protein
VLPLTRRAVLVSATVALVAALAPAAPAPAAPASPYQYPVRPGTAAWAALPNHDAMLAVTQLPTGLARKLSTDQLVSTVLAYPMFRDMQAFNTPQQGFDTMAGRFNGLTELLARKDAGTALLARYRALDVRTPAGATLAKAGDHTYEVAKVETLLAQPQVLATLSANQRATALKVARDKYAAKQAQADVYGLSGLEPTAVFLGRALAVTEGWDWKQSTLLRTGSAASKSMLASVLPAVEAHLAQPTVAHPVDDGIRTQDYGSSIRTPRGTSVPVTVRDWELSSSQIASGNAWVASNYPSASRETDTSRRYNCHSYAWYWTSHSNNVWLNTPGDDAFWNDGSYTRWHPPYIYFSGMRWNWPVGDHSGIEVGTSGYIRSKWGELPRMYHRWDYSPYNRTNISQYFLS